MTSCFEQYCSLGSQMLKDFAAFMRLESCSRKSATVHYPEPDETYSVITQETPGSPKRIIRFPFFWPQLCIHLSSPHVSCAAYLILDLNPVMTFVCILKRKRNVKVLMCPDQ
jgi:hypothetical protein